MGIIYDKDAKEKELYSAYGLTVYGKENRYDSIFSPNVKSVYITLRISDGERNLVDEYLGNNCIFPNTFTSTIDNFLWWLIKDKPDKYDVEKMISKCLCASDCLFNTRIENRKWKEKQELEAAERHIRQKAEDDKKIEEIKQYCNRKKLIFKQNWEGIYLIKPKNDLAREVIENADLKHLDKYIEYMQYDEVSDATLVMNGNLEQVYEFIRR